MTSNNKVWQFKWLEYLSYFLVFIVPLYYNMNHWGPFGAPKTLLIIGISLIILMLYIWGKVSLRNDWYVSFSWPHIALLSYFLVLTLSAIFGVDSPNSFFGTFDQPASLVMLYGLGIYAFIVGFLVSRDNSFIKKSIIIAFVSGVLVTIISYTGNSILHISQEGSTIGNNSYLGAYLLFITCFGVWIFIQSKKHWQKILSGLGVLLILFSPSFFNSDILKGKFSIGDAFHHPALFLGLAAGATLGLIVAILISLFFAMIRGKRNFTRILGMILFVLFSFSLFFTWHELVTPDTVINNGFITQKSANRFLFWDIANQGFVERPIFGYGFGNYFTLYESHFSADIFRPGFSIEPWVSQPHNIVYEYLSTTGILGLLGYIFLFGSLLIVFFNNSIDKDGKRNALFILFLGALIGEFVQNLFVFDTPTTYLMMFLLIGIAISYSPKIFHFSLPVKNLNTKKSIAGVISVLAFLCIIFLVIKPWHESKQLKKLTEVKNISDIPKLISGIQDISVMGNIKDTSHFTDTYNGLLGKLTSRITDDNRKNILDVTRKVADNLEQELQKYPNNFRGHLVVGELLNQYIIIARKFNETIIMEARQNLFDAKKINSDNVITYIALAQNYAIGKDMKTSHLYLREAILLAPQYLPTYQFAEELNKIVPDKKFGDYLQRMKMKWNPNIQ